MTIKDQTAPNLLPCPFCGERLNLDADGDAVHPGDTCFLDQDIVFSLAFEDWNRRAAPVEVAGLVERLTDAYALVALMPEKQPDGFMNLLALRNMVPEATYVLEAAHAASAAKDAEIARLTAEVATLKRTYNQLFDATQVEQARAERAEAALAESEAKLKQALEAETRACAEVVWLLAQGFAGMGSGLYMEAAHKCRDAILARLDQPAGEA